RRAAALVRRRPAADGVHGLDHRWLRELVSQRRRAQPDAVAGIHDRVPAGHPPGGPGRVPADRATGPPPPNPTPRPRPGPRGGGLWVSGRLPGGGGMGLIGHPRFGRMMIRGGHVEPEESPAEAAVREVAEETGLAVTLVSPPAAPVPPGYRARRVAPPWWIA